MKQMDSINGDCYGTNELGDSGTTYILGISINDIIFMIYLDIMNHEVTFIEMMSSFGYFLESKLS